MTKNEAQKLHCMVVTTFALVGGLVFCENE